MSQSAVETTYYGLNQLDRKLERYVDFDGGFYVELGANNGVDQSNTYYFEKQRNWRGVLVEPTPHNYLYCRANRSPANRIFCAACVSFDYREKFVPIAYSNLMSTPIGLQSDIAEPLAHAQVGRQFLHSYEDVFVFGALATPLNVLLLQAEAPSRIDLLSLDVEGAELEVLKGIDHDAFRFRYLCIECRDVERLKAYLFPRNYRLVDQLSQHDYLFACNITLPR